MATDLSVIGCCPLDCQDTCSWRAHVRDGRVVRLEGARDHPITRGALCAKVNDYQERTYAPDRILTPLRRVGAKGEGRFERVGWDEALDEIAGRLRSIAELHGAEAILPVNYLGSMGVIQRRALMRVFHALGASRFHGSVCGASGNVLEAEGHPRGFDPEEFVHSRLILLWGSNLLSTSHHQWHFMQRARAAGARIVAIDPIRTRTARAADDHISIRPGTDHVLAASIAQVMLSEGTADLEYARTAVADLDRFLSMVTPWDPERAGAICELDPAIIRRLAAEFASARPAAIRSGVAPQQTATGERFVRSLSALAILGGHWRHHGGGLYIETGPVMDESRAARPDLLGRPTRSLDLARLGEHLLDRTLEPTIQGLVVWGMNPAVTQPDASLVRSGLAREDLFTVVLEHFLTDTARYADIVLPSTTQLEHFDVQGSWGHHYISANLPAVPPCGEALPHGEIMRRLAARLGLDHPALRETDEEIAAAVLPSGLTLTELIARGWYKNSPRRADPGRDGSALRIADAPLEARPRPSGDQLQLLTPKSHYFLNSTFANMPRHRAAMDRPTLDIHPVDAASRSIEDGGTVTIRSADRVLTVQARLSDALHPGVVALAGKWWSEPAETAAVANLLTSSAWSPGGQPSYNDTFVTVECAPGT